MNKNFALPTPPDGMRWEIYDIANRSSQFNLRLHLSGETGGFFNPDDLSVYDMDFELKLQQAALELLQRHERDKVHDEIIKRNKQIVEQINHDK